MRMTIIEMSMHETFFFFFTVMQTETNVQSQLVKLFQVEICSEKMTCKISIAPRNHPRTQVLKCSKFRVCFGKRQNECLLRERVTIEEKTCAHSMVLTRGTFGRTFL